MDEMRTASRLNRASISIVSIREKRRWSRKCCSSSNVRGEGYLDRYPSLYFAGTVMMLHREITCFRACIRLFLFLLFANVTGLAGTTGKISGKITDGQTKEALAGVNVLVAGTALGAASDLEGSYFIINLPPGTYRLKASAVGYAPTVINDVKVFVDQTTRIDFALRQ